MLLQSCRGKWKETSARNFFKLSEKNLPHGSFHNLATFQKYASAANDFRVIAKRGKQHYQKKCKQIRYLNILNIINILTLQSADAKSAILLKFPSLTKVEVRNFPLLNFPRWFCLANGQLAMSLRRVKRSVICKFQCSCLFDIQQRSALSQSQEKDSLQTRAVLMEIFMSC